MRVFTLVLEAYLESNYPCVGALPYIAFLLSLTQDFYLALTMPTPKYGQLSPHVCDDLSSIKRDNYKN